MKLPIEVKLTLNDDVGLEPDLEIIRLHEKLDATMTGQQEEESKETSA